MAGNFTLFTNDSGAASGAIDYVKDAFQDVSLPATTNTGLTSNSNTNPLGDFFANDDAPRYGAKTLYIKDFVLIDDRSKWISNKPTYRIIWNEAAPWVHGYLFGNLQLNSETGQPYITVKTIGDGIGITCVGRRVQFLVDDNTAATATAQVVTDGVSGSTIDFSSLAANSDATDVARYSAYVHAASNEAAGLHDFRLTALQVNTLNLLGVVVYAENTGINLDLYPGTTYVNKSKITTASGATLALTALGSSLGGNTLVYKTQASGYALSALSATTIASIAQGSSGTNLVTVSTGHGASFPAGTGFVVAQGSSMYVGSVLSVSTDTLTVSPTLGFGLTNAIYRSWLSGSTYSINASLMTLAHSIDFTKLVAGASNQVFEPRGNYAVWGSNFGVTTIDSISAARFLGASGFIQVDGYFSAAEIEMIGGAILSATLSINGTPGWSVNAGQTGQVRRTIFTEGGPGWNSFVFGAGASLGDIGIAKINLYRRSQDIGTSFGQLASFDTIQAYTERTAINATLMSMGTHRRRYADQLYLKGSWVRGTTFTVPGGVQYFGASTNSVLRYEYYGQNFAVLGVAGGGTLAIDGVGTALTFNAMKSVATEGFHTITYSVGSGATAQIFGIDTTRTNSDLKNHQNFSALGASLPVSPGVPTVQKFLSGSGTYALPSPAPKYLRVTLVGGGGGGAGSANTTNDGGTGGTGGDTTFGPITGSGGVGGVGGAASAGGAGGAASLGTGPVGLAIAGGKGGGAGQLAAAYTVGGMGGNSALGGGGGNGQPLGGGTAGQTNTGGGGGGGTTDGSGGSHNSGAGGGAGGYVEAIIAAPCASYSYGVGAAGAAGAAGTGGFVGGAGGSGVIVVEEYYS